MIILFILAIKDIWCARQIGMACTIKGFYFKWLYLQGIDAAFPISIKLILNHLK